MISREKRIVIEISGAKSSIHGRSKVDFYYNHGIHWIEVTNETVKSAAAIRAICQVLSLVVRSDHPERLFASELG